jgi:hypothetical protein
VCGVSARRAIPAVIVGATCIAVVAVAGFVAAGGGDDSNAAPSPRSSLPPTTSATAHSGHEVDCGKGLTPGQDTTGEPTAVQRAAAEALVDDTKAALQPFTDFQHALDVGFRRLDGIHWYQPQWYGDDDALDPTRPEFVMYDDDRTLLGAMYIEHSGPGPQLGGSLTSWHTHCPGEMPCRLPGDRLYAMESPECRDHPPVRDWMLHVWIVPNELGPFGHEMIAPT